MYREREMCNIYIYIYIYTYYTYTSLVVTELRRLVRSSTAPTPSAIFDEMDLVRRLEGGNRIV